MSGVNVAIPVIDDGTYHGLDITGGTPAAPASLVRVRQGNAIQWTAANPVLRAGEQAREQDTGRWKIGDGVTAWTSLGYEPVIVDGGTP